MRGIILRFDGQEGLVSCQGTQYPFALDHWKSDKPPAVGQAVEFQLTDGTISNLHLVETAQVAQEKAKVYLGYAQQFGQATYQQAGKSVTIAYALFALLALFADTIRNVPVTLPGLINGLSWSTLYRSDVNSGFGFFLVLLAILSIAVPTFWNHRAAPLAYCVPLVAEVIGLYNLFDAINEISSFAGAIDQRMGNDIRAHAFDAITLWSWLTLFVVLYLAYVGFRRYRQGMPSAPQLPPNH